MLALLIGKARIILQILQRHDLLLGQRAEPADKHMRSGSEQRMIADPIFPHRPAQDRLIERIQIQYADLASQPGHIFDDLMGLRLTDAEIILFSAMFFQLARQMLLPQTNNAV